MIITTVALHMFILLPAFVVTAACDSYQAAFLGQVLSLFSRHVLTLEGLYRGQDI